MRPDRRPLRHWISDKTGGGYVSVCVGVLAFVTLFAFFLSYFSTLSGIRANRENMQRVLDSFVTRTSKDIYARVKRGNAGLLDGEWDERFWDWLSVSELGIRTQAQTQTGNRTLEARGEDGTLKWVMTAPALSFAEGNEDVLRLRADYVLTVPVPFGGILLGNMDVPVSVEAHFLPK